MPIAQYKPDVKSTVKTELPKIEPEAYKSVVQDDNRIALNTLITYVEGAPWSINYYAQVLSKNNDLKDLDIGQTGIYQQYSKTIGLELRVTTPLTSSQDNDSSLVTVSGTGLMLPFMTPNPGDVFTAGAGGGRDGLYRISTVDRKTFDRESVFSIEYELVGYLDTIADVYADLENKVIRTYYFDKERLVEGGQPNLIESDHRHFKDLKGFYKILCEFYFKTFFNRETSTLILPGQGSLIYDSFLVRYLLKMVDTMDAYEIRFVKDLTTENDPFLQQPQFWNVLLNRDASMLGFCNRDMGLVNTHTFGSDPMMQGIRFSKVQYIIYPKEGDQSVFSEPYVPELRVLNADYTYNRVIVADAPAPEIRVLALEDIVEAKTTGGSIAALLRDNLIEQNAATPLVKPAFANSSYVFSPEFYQGGAGQSVLESLTMDYIKGNPVNIEQLWTVTNGFRKWGRLEQFYYIPILLTLIKATAQGLY